MSVIRSIKLENKLDRLKKYIYERQRFQFDESTGEFIRDTKTNRKKPIESHPPKYCNQIASKRLLEINQAIDGLTHSANTNHTFTTPKGRTVYFTVPSKRTANTYIFYTIVLNNGQQDLYVFDVRLKGFPLDKILEIKDSYNYFCLPDRKSYKERIGVPLFLEQKYQDKHDITILEYLISSRF